MLCSRSSALAVLGAAVTLALAAAPVASPSAAVASARVAKCSGFGFGNTTVVNVKRSPHMSCVKARDLVRATFHEGPLHVVREEMTVGHPIVHVAGGWSCFRTARLTNGDSGVGCTSDRHPSWNAVDDGLAVFADVHFS